MSDAFIRPRPLKVDRSEQRRERGRQRVVEPEEHQARLQAKAAEVAAALARENGLVLDTPSKTCQGCGQIAPGTATQMRRRGWCQEQDRGWLCPLCQRKLRARRTPGGGPGRLTADRQ